MNHLSLDQAPPITVVGAFFATAPLFVILAGALVWQKATTVFGSPWFPETLALTHLGTVGFLAMVMVGALYQMLPVVGGARVPLVRSAHLSHLALSVGALGFAVGGFGAGATWFAHASWLLVAGLAVFAVPVGIALVRTQTQSGTVAGMRLALLSLLSVAGLGYVMSRGFDGAAVTFDRGDFIQLHLSLGLLGWVGALLTSVSWQVVPMFYLAESVSPLEQRLTLVSIASLVLLLPLSPLLLLVDPQMDLGVIGLLVAFPAGYAVWVHHPWSQYRALAKRRRKRHDDTLRLWKLGLALGPATAALGTCSVWLDDPRWGLSFGWVAIWGWAGLIVHGTIHRIVPFLIWFHRLSRHVGFAMVPSAKQLLPGPRTARGMWLHLASLGLGLVAVWTEHWLLARATGVGLVLTGASLVDAFVRAHAMGQCAEREAERSRSVLDDG